MTTKLRRHAMIWLAGAAFACSAGSAVCTPAGVDVTALLDQADAIRSTDHTRFAAILAQVHAEKGPLTSGQRWRLRMLDGVEAQFQGNYAEAEKVARDVLDNSGHPGLSARAMGMLIQNFSINHRYEEAFTLARRAVAVLPGLKDPVARQSLLSNLSQSMNDAGHPDLAIKYAQMMRSDLSPGESPCMSMSVEMAARYTQKISPESPELSQAIDECTRAGATVWANMNWLTKTARFIEIGKPDTALAILDRIAPSIEKIGYFQGKAALYSQRGNAYLALNKDADARNAALATVALFRPGSMDTFLRDAYHVLYEVERRAKRDSVALAYYQKYAEQERGNLDDLTARTLAYEAVQQRALLQGLEAEKLAHQNSVLQLEQSLTSKAVEAGRLYIALLAVLLASVVFWLIRTKRSQLRFKRMSCQDGLTGVANHQYFMTELERGLHDLERRNAPACLVLLDLDHFKLVNDTYGHAIGDAVLKCATATCRQQLRPVDLLGRLGGEEFGILLPECQAEQGLVIANCIRAALEAAPLAVDGHVVTYSASIGVACTRISGYGLQRIRREADAALYRAKNMGRNRVMTDFQDMGFANA
ncbi:MAG TPA: GGDEF domain-containing protein [Luteibacter sp.]|jgi:diguanylate cyclase (GGDEF)-like protein|uniref:GGDEF domain-containing protein n=1 Tax=Luteibacter sp. TaxID=1886636 RepID=UPI002F3F1CFC